MDKTLANISRKLKDNSLRVTNSRTLVACTLIDNQENFLTAEEIHSKIVESNENCDLVSVYRTLSSFDEIGLVKRSDFKQGASRYILNSNLATSKKHEHFFKCVKCYSVEAFSDCLISKKEKELTLNGYKNLSHHIEITGLCPKCAVL